MGNIYCGLDISDRTVEIVAVRKKGQKLDVQAAVRAELPSGLIDRGVILNPDGFGKILGEYLNQVFGKRRKIVAGIAVPEQQSYSRTLHLPPNLDAELARQALAVEAEKRYPINVHASFMAFATLGGDETGQDYFCSLVERPVLRPYLQALAKAGVEPKFFEMESSALARVVVRDEKPSVVVDIGARTSMVAVVDEGHVRQSANIMIGGDSLTEAIETKMQMTYAQAEKTKRQAGFDPNVDDGRVFLILQKPIAKIIDEVKHTVAYYERHSGHEIRRLYLAGGSSLLPGIVEYLKPTFPDWTVEVANPLRGLAVDELHNAGAVLRQHVLFATATGLAIRVAGVVTESGLDYQIVEDNPTRLSLITKKILQILKLPIMATKKITKKEAKKSPPKRKGAEKKEDVRKPEVLVDLKSLGSVVAEKKMEAPATSVPEELKEVPAVKLVTVEADEDEDDDRPSPPSVPHEFPALVPAAKEVEDKPLEATRDAGEQTAGLPMTIDTDEKDYGSGIGDILTKGDDTALPVPEIITPPLELSADAKDVRRLKIEDILSKRGGSEEHEAMPTEDEDTDNMISVAVSRERRRSIRLLVLVALLFIAAAVSVMILVRKHGLPEWASAIDFTKDSEPVAEEVTETLPIIPESVSASVLLVTTMPDESEQQGMKVILSRAIETDVSITETFTATGEGDAPATNGQPTKATGTISIVNNAGRTFNFVATTRFLASDGTLFRTVKPVAVAATGETTVEVAADVAGPAGNIAPTTFTIPGLSLEMQKQITGRSDASMSGGSDGLTPGTKVPMVMEADIQSAKESLAAKLLEEAKANFAVMLTGSEVIVPDLITATDIEVVAPAVGALQKDFTLKLNQRYRAFLVPESEVTPVLGERLAEVLPAGSDATSFTLGTPFYLVEADEGEQVQLRAEANLISQ